MTDSTEFLDLDDLLDLATRLLGDPPPVRDLGLLGSAVARPQTSVFGSDAYPTIWTKAAALLDSIVNNHPLVDGNKRLGWLATAVFLTINDVDVTGITNDSVVDLVLSIAAGRRSVDEVAADLERLARP